MTAAANVFRGSQWLAILAVAAAPALAQNVALPIGRNLHERPDETGDVVLDIDRSGAYALGGQPIAAAELVGQLARLTGRTLDHVVYVRADAGLPVSAIDAASALATRANVCVLSFVGTQRPGAPSLVSGDAGEEAGSVRRAIDVQLPAPRVSPMVMARQQASAIVLEVLPGPAYRINTEQVSAANLELRLRQIFSPRPIKLLYLRADPAAAYAEVFHAMDEARFAGVVDIVAAPAELGISGTLPVIDLSMRVTSRSDSAAARIEGNTGRCRRGDVYGGRAAGSGGIDARQGHAYFEFQVERPATRLDDGVVLVYPDMLRSARVNGEVLAQFIVDTSGHVVPETFKVLETTHILFAQSVRDALPSMRFAPATIAGKAVPQVVQQPFYFNVTP